FSSWKWFTHFCFNGLHRGRTDVYWKAAAANYGRSINTLGLEAQEVLMVGDNYETDILAGIHTKMDTLMVLTGYSTKEDLAVKYDQPTYIMNNLFEWIEKRQEEE